MVSGSQDLTIKLWTLPAEWSGKGSDQGPVSLTAKLTEKAHDKDINSVTVSPNDKLIASGSQDKTAKVGDSQPRLCSVSFPAMLVAIIEQEYVCI